MRKDAPAESIGQAHLLRGIALSFDISRTSLPAFLVQDIVSGPAEAPEYQMIATVSMASSRNQIIQEIEEVCIERLVVLLFLGRIMNPHGEKYRFDPYRSPGYV
jgi:hypothetical protein